MRGAGASEKPVSQSPAPSVTHTPRRPGQSRCPGNSSRAGGGEGGSFPRWLAWRVVAWEGQERKLGARAGTDGEG